MIWLRMRRMRRRGDARVARQNLLRQCTVVLGQMRDLGHKAQDVAGIPHQIALGRRAVDEAAQRQAQPRQQPAEFEEAVADSAASPSTLPSSQDSTITG